MINTKLLHTMQEITFWHALNDQLHDMKAKGVPVTDSQHEHLKTFCLNRSLFKKINQKEYLDDIPLALCTDLSGISFFAPYQKPWIEDIIKIIRSVVPSILIFNIEQALVTAYNQIQRLDKKHGFIKLTLRERKEAIAADNDPQLYNFINEFNDAKKSAAMGFADIITQLFDAHDAFLQNLLAEPAWEKHIKIVKKNIVFDTTKHVLHS